MHKLCSNQCMFICDSKVYYSEVQTALHTDHTVPYTDSEIVSQTTVRCASHMCQLYRAASYSLC